MLFLPCTSEQFSSQELQCFHCVYGFSMTAPSFKAVILKTTVENNHTKPKLVAWQLSIKSPETSVLDFSLGYSANGTFYRQDFGRLALPSV